MAPNEKEEERLTVRRKETHLDQLDNKLSGGLTEDMRSEPSVVPNSRPPRSVDLVVLELSTEEDGDEELVDEPLDEQRGDQTKQRMRGVPDFQEPLQKRQSKH